MITDSFSKEKGMMSPKDLYGPGQDISDICIAFFSWKIVEDILEKYHPALVATIHSTNTHSDIYSMDFHGKRICFYNSFMGSALAGTCLEEAHHLVGATKFIMFGSCGRLDKNLRTDAVIVPTAAYRDEGYSYHYAAPQDYIDVRNHATLESFFSRNAIPFETGKCWTTDAFYKETKTEMKKRRQEGCMVVDMECAGCQAVCDYYGWGFYEYFFADDLLDAPVWDKGDIGTENAKDHHLAFFELALRIAAAISEKAAV
jgi:uridine phosphorylase